MSLKRQPLPLAGGDGGGPTGRAAVDPEAERTVLRVGGMDCASCAVTVERRVALVPGVSRAAVNFAAGRLDVEHDPRLGQDEIEGAVEAAGYSVEHRGAGAGGEPFWKTPGVAPALAAFSLLAVGLAARLGGAPQGAWVLACALAIVVGGMPIFRAALGSLRVRRADMNVLMSAAALGAVGIGAWGEAALVISLFSAGNALQSYAVGRARDAVRELAELVPDETPVLRDGEEVSVPVAEIWVGETIVVRPGQRIALDAEAIEGSTTVDEAPVTGESTPVEKSPGDELLSGSLNGSGALLARVSRTAEDSTLQRAARAVEEAQANRAPTERFVDRFSGVYTPLVVAAAAGLAVVPSLLGADPGTWIYRALALLIVACPCALVISTPVTVVSGIGAASRRGILVKGGEALEAAGSINTLVLDKTGTLTEGRPILSRVVPTGALGETEALRIAGALESRSEHPLAHAILTAARERAGGLPAVSDFLALPGRGAEGEVEGSRYLVGSPTLFSGRGIGLAGADPALRLVEEAGETPVVLGDEGGPIAVFGLADEIRPGAREALDALRAAGVGSLVMLTGDAEAPARRVARELGIEYRAGLLPEDKAGAVRELSRRGPVGMVGDGVNDAPALAAARASFAMGAGSGVALEAADVALVGDDLAKLAESVELSRSAERIIRQNVFVSLLVKGVFVLLAPLGFVSLWAAVLADMGTSLAVTANGTRLLRGRPRR